VESAITIGSHCAAHFCSRECMIEGAVVADSSGKVNPRFVKDFNRMIELELPQK